MKLPEHATLHTTEYYKAVNEALAGVKTKQEATAVLQSIGEKLRAGDFPQ